MRKLVLTIIFLFLFSSVALAGSSTYEGYPIINVKVDDQLVESTVPGIAINGTTLVPLRAISESMGADIAYDSKTKTAIINTKIRSVNHDQIKLYVTIMNHYRMLEDNSESFKRYSEGLRLVIGQYNNNPDYYDTMVGYFNETVQRHNELVKNTDQLILVANESGIDVSDMRKILDNIQESIDYYKIAFSSLKKHLTYHTEKDHRDYLNNESAGWDTAFQAGKDSYNGYLKFHQMILNY